MGDIVPPPGPWSSLEPHPSGMCSEILTREVCPGGILTRCPNHYIWLSVEEQRLYPLPDDQASHLTRPCLEILSIEEQEWWQWAQSNTHWKQTWLAATKLWHRLHRPWGSSLPHILVHAPQESHREHHQMLYSSPQTTCRLSGKLPCSLQDSAEGVDLDYCCTARLTTTPSPEPEGRLSEGKSSAGPLDILTREAECVLSL